MVYGSDDLELWEVKRRGTDGGDILTIELEHPKSAIHYSGLHELLDVVEGLVNDDQASVLVFTGGPDAFCTGMDITEFSELVEDTDLNSTERKQQIDEFTRLFHASILALRDAPQPVIGAVDGAAAGGGFSLALAMDLVYATPESSFTHAYTDIAVTSDGGSTYFLPRLVGLQKAKELIFTGRSLSAEEMADLGLVNQVVEGDLEASVSQLAEELASRPSDTIASVKRLLNDGIEASLETQLEHERKKMKEAVQRAEFESRIQQFLNN